jgi:iron complex transport system substrate-binding protein
MLKLIIYGDTGTEVHPFEVILEKAQQQEFWIAPGDFSSLKQMSDSNPHYQEFESFKIKKVYSYALNKGAKGYSLFRMVSYPSGLGFKGFHKDISSRISTKPHTVFFQKLE